MPSSSEVRTLEALGGDLLYDLIAKAVEESAEHDAEVQFAFNGEIIRVEAGEDFGAALARLEERHGYPIKSREALAKEAGEWLERTKREQAQAIAAAKAPTEEELHDAAVPWLHSEDELVGYIRSLVDRPHDYGTCVYAMSMAATAAYQYAAHKLGTTGFQASCADMDILRRTRGWEWGRILDYSKLLYPQYCDAEHFPSVVDLMRDPDVRTRLKKMAAEKLAESNGNTHPNVKAHWERLAAWSLPDA